MLYEAPEWVHVFSPSHTAVLPLFDCSTSQCGIMQDRSSSLLEASKNGEIVFLSFDRSVKGIKAPRDLHQQKSTVSSAFSFLSISARVHYVDRMFCTSDARSFKTTPLPPFQLQSVSSISQLNPLAMQFALQKLHTSFAF